MTAAEWQWRSAELHRAHELRVSDIHAAHDDELRAEAERHAVEVRALNAEYLGANR